MSKTQFINRNKLRGAMAEHGLTQVKVAEKLTITVQSLSGKMQGKYAFTESEIASLKDLFGLGIFIL
jgi:transcriptional regulator with XRE-family HTH domain